MNKLFEIQPESCRQPLPYKVFKDYDGEFGLRTSGPAILFDPGYAYQNAFHLIDPYSRTQTGLNKGNLFPKLEKVCNCGCGNAAKYWYKNHGNIAWLVTSIIRGDTSIIRKLLYYYYGYVCSACGDDCTTKLAQLDADHIIPVKHGGGGSWLSNYVWLCKTCHNDKTNKDFQHGKYKDIGPNQIQLDL